MVWSAGLGIVKCVVFVAEVFAQKMAGCWTLVLSVPSGLSVGCFCVMWSVIVFVVFGCFYYFDWLMITAAPARKGGTN
jgi:hypothetical protein